MLVIENDTDVTDSDGRPPHSVNVIVYPAPVAEDRETLARLIFENKAAGIKAHGAPATTIPIDDSMGIVHLIGYDVAAETYIVFDVLVDKGPDYPDNGDDQIVEQLTIYLNGGGVDNEASHQVGQDVSHVAAVARLYNNIPGIEDLQLEIGFKGGAPPAEDPLTIPFDEVARVEDPDTDITVGSL